MLVSVILPIHNEAESLPLLLEQLAAVLRPLEQPVEVLCIDDGSSDGSMEVLEKLAHTHWPIWTAQAEGTKSTEFGIRNAEKTGFLRTPHSTFRIPFLHLIQFRRNFGKAAALQAGFDAAQGAFIITMDADLQDDPAEIPRLIAKLEEGYDLVSGWKQQRQDPLSKTLPSRMFNRITAWLTGIRLHDFNCGLKAYRREVVESLHLYGELHRYIPVLAHQQGFRVTEIPVQHHPRRFGNSKYGWKRLLRGGLDLLTVLFLTHYLRCPLHLFGAAGLGLISVGFGVNAYLATLRLSTGSIQSHHPLLMLGVLLMVLGFQSLTMGLLGEMLCRHEAKTEQGYSIAKQGSVPSKQGVDP